MCAWELQCGAALSATLRTLRFCTSKAFRLWPLPRQTGADTRSPSDNTSRGGRSVCCAEPRKRRKAAGTVAEAPKMPDRQNLPVLLLPSKKGLHNSAGYVDYPIAKRDGAKRPAA